MLFDTVRILVVLPFLAQASNVERTSLRKGESYNAFQIIPEDILEICQNQFHRCDPNVADQSEFEFLCETFHFCPENTWMCGSLGIQCKHRRTNEIDKLLCEAFHIRCPTPVAVETTEAPTEESTDASTEGATENSATEEPSAPIARALVASTPKMEIEDEEDSEISTLPTVSPILEELYTRHISEPRRTLEYNIYLCRAFGIRCPSTPTVSEPTIEEEEEVVESIIEEEISVEEGIEETIEESEEEDNQDDDATEEETVVVATEAPSDSVTEEASAGSSTEMPTDASSDMGTYEEVSIIPTVAPIEVMRHLEASSSSTKGKEMRRLETAAPSDSGTEVSTDASTEGSTDGSTEGASEGRRLLESQAPSDSDVPSGTDAPSDAGSDSTTAYASSGRRMLDSTDAPSEEASVGSSVGSSTEMPSDAASEMRRHLESTDMPSDVSTGASSSTDGPTTEAPSSPVDESSEDDGISTIPTFSPV